MFVNTKCIYSVIKIFVAQCKVLFNTKVLFLSDIVYSTLFGNQPHTPKIHWGGGRISVIIEQALLKELRAEAKSPCSVLKT